MSPFRLSIPALLFAATAFTQQISSTIHTCADVECPVRAPSTIANCSVAGSVGYTAVGIVSFSEEPAGSLSWTIGISQKFPEDSSNHEFQSVIERVLYLGVDPSTDLTTSQATGCAFLLTDSINYPVFYNAVNATPTDCVSDQSTVGLPKSCVTSFTAQAKQLATASDASCDSIATSLETYLPTVCPLSSVSIRGVQLTGSGGALPITMAQNASSNCWPTLPKSNALIPAFNYSVNTGTANVLSAAGGASPVLTLFFTPGDDSPSPSAELVCVSASGLTAAGLKTTLPNATVRAWPFSQTTIGVAVMSYLVSSFI